MARVAIVSILGLLALSGCGAAELPPAAVPDRPAGTLVFVSGENRLTAVDVASGRRTSRRIRSVPSCGAQLFVTGGHIVFSGIVKGWTTVFSIPLALDRRPRRLGAAHMFVESATDGRVWLAGTDCDDSRMSGVREVTMDGTVTFESDHRVPGTYVAGAVPDGLLISRGRALRVWNPATGAGRRLPVEWAFGTEGSLLTGCAAGSDCNELAIHDSASGRTVPVHGDLDLGGIFSPDGAWLATAARTGRRWRVALVDVRTGTHTIVRGSRTGKSYPELRWARSGWLFIRDGRRVRAYLPGAPRAERLPIRLPRSAAAFAAA